jgi:glycosyltransferase involved in cell wall biosynthesis
MKICLITNLYPPYDRGGAEKIVYLVACELAKRGHEIIVITACPWRGIKSLKPVLTIENKVKVYRFYPLNIFFYTNDSKHNIFVRFVWHFLDLFNFHSAIVVKKILKKEKPEIVHCHGLHGLGFLIPLILRFSKKWIQTLHAVVFANPNTTALSLQPKYLQFATKIYAKIVRRLIGSPPLVISPSKFLLDYYLKQGFFKFSQKIILRNFAITNKISNFADQLPHKVIKFFYIGQIEEPKGVIFLLNAFKKLKAANCELHFIGTGSKLDQINKLAAKDLRIIVHGQVPHEEICIFLNEADFLIVPSLCLENSPTVIYEAFAAGVPVLGSRIGGISELIEEGKNGFTFEPGNEESLLFYLNYIIDNQGEIEIMRRAAFKAGKQFSLAAHVKKIIEIYSNLVKS